MKHKALKRIFAALVCVLTCACTVVPTVALSPDEPLYGTVAGGLWVKGGSTALALEHTDLYLDMSELPPENFETDEAFLAYGAQLTATYTLYNPTNATVTAELMTPMGATPDYGRGLTVGVDAHKYTVSVDGTQVQTALRHAYTYNVYAYETDRMYYASDESYWRSYGLSYLSDELYAQGLYSPDTPVYAYTYHIAPTDGTENFMCRAELPAYSESRLICSSDLWFDAQGEMYHYQYMDELVTLYVVGEDYADWQWHAEDYDHVSVPVDVTLQEKRQLTFYELCMMDYDAASGASEVDYYNAYVAYLLREDGVPGTERLFGAGYGLHGNSSLLGWQCFTLTLAPGERTEVTVCAPLYPFVDDSNLPKIYTYAVSLSQPDQWSDYGQTSVHAQTKHHLHKREMRPEPDAFSKVKDGYVYEGELDGHYLVVSTCKSRVSVDVFGSFLVVLLLGALLIALVGLLIGYGWPVVAAAVVIVVILLLVRRHNKKKDHAQPKQAEVQEPLKEIKEEDHEQNDT